MRKFLVPAAGLCAALTARPMAAPLKVACIGNSITAGFGIPDSLRATKAYPAVLGRLLGPGYVVNNYGVSSTTLLKRGNKPYWNESAFAASTAWLPDIVIIQLGTNDTKGMNAPYYGDFQSDYTAMLRHFLGLSSHPKVFANLPPTIYSVYKDSSTCQDTTLVKYLIPKIKLAAKQLQVPLIDVHAATGGHADLFPDKLHPDTTGAKLIAQTVYAGMTSATAAAPGARAARAPAANPKALGNWQVTQDPGSVPGSPPLIRGDGREIQESSPEN